PKSMFIWLAASAIILISGVLLYPTITDDAVLPGDENQPSEETPTGTDDPGNQGGADSGGDDGESDDPSDSIGSGENEEGNEDDDMQVEELGNETYDIMIEGMEESSTLYLFRLSPYEIDYEIDDILSDYVIEDNSVKHHAEDEDAASFRLSVKENATID